MLALPPLMQLKPCESAIAFWASIFFPPGEA
jgi:hypothetical protein